MTDTNQQIARYEGKIGLGKVGSAILTGWLTSYFMNQLSLHGINFETAGISSEMVKSSIESFIVGISVWATPAHFAAAITDGITFVKTTLKQWRDAWNS